MSAPDAHAYQDAPPEPAGDVVGIYDWFWRSRPILTHLHTFARARLVSPWAVLGATLARTCTAISPWVALPPIVAAPASLNTYIGLVGESGDGKDGAADAAIEALDIGPITMLGIGSGEGIAHQYVTYRKPTKDDPGGLEQYRHAVLFTASEVDTLTALQRRQASTVMPELRKAWTGRALGFAYVDKEKRLQIPAHGYRLALIVGIQPERARPLLNDVDAGTPQRFIWLPAADPDIPDDTPTAPPPMVWKPPTAGMVGANGLYLMDVCQTARDTIIRNRRAQHRGDANRINGHALLCRLKVAGLFGLLDDRLNINDQDWTLGGIVVTKSEWTRNQVTARLTDVDRARNTAQALAESDRAIIVNERMEDHTVRRVAQNIRRNLTREWSAHNTLRRRVTSRDRQWFDAAIDALIKAGQIDQDETHNTGPDGCRYRLTDERP